MSINEIRIAIAPAAFAVTVAVLGLVAFGAGTAGHGSAVRPAVVTHADGGQSTPAPQSSPSGQPTSNTNDPWD